MDESKNLAQVRQSGPVRSYPSPFPLTLTLTLPFPLSLSPLSSVAVSLALQLLVGSKPAQGMRVNQVKYQIIRSVIDEASNCYCVHGKKVRLAALSVCLSVCLSV